MAVTEWENCWRAPAVTTEYKPLKKALPPSYLYISFPVDMAIAVMVEVGAVTEALCERFPNRA
jgi:hypothetical protein